MKLSDVEPLAIFRGDGGRADDLDGLVARSVSAGHIIVWIEKENYSFVSYML